MSAAPSQDDRPRIAIIGGGFSGATVAWHLINMLGRDHVVVTIFEPRSRIGAGLAYDTDEPAHRINVPASRMSLDPAVPDSFQAWIEANHACDDDPDVQAEDGHLYPRRSVFGRYVAQALEPQLLAGGLNHNRSKIVTIGKGRQGFILHDDKGHLHRADHVVLATSHPAPAPPGQIATALAGYPLYVPDATRPYALAAIGEDDRVLVIGNGLTAADVIATLAARGHRGTIHALSRRGLVSRGHARRAQEPWGDFVTRQSRTASDLLRRIRQAIHDAEAFGISWHAVIDAVRAQGQTIWQALPVAERRRIVRHIRPFWDVHRFRIAPQVETVLENLRNEGRLHHLAGRIGPVARTGNFVTVSITPRGGHAPFTLAVDAVVVTTGPAHGSVLETAPHLKSLANAGLVAIDATGLGLACDLSARILDRDGKVVEGLFVAGPLARGTFGELMGLPQVADHAHLVATKLVETLDRTTKEQAASAAA